MSSNWKAIEGNWTELMGKFKEQWGKLTDDELKEISGKRSQLQGALEKKYGYTSSAAEAQIEKFVTTIDTKKYDNRSSTL